MASKTGIEWTDSTWNPIRGCSRVSEGCRHCYAESVAYRFKGPGQPYEGLAVLKNGHPSWTGEIKFVEEHLLDPLKWKAIPVQCDNCRIFGTKAEGCDPMLLSCQGRSERPRRIFVNSMSDLFRENVTDEMRDKIFAVMALCPQHVFQVLTKRPARMLAYLVSCVGRLADVIESMRFDKPRRAVGPLPHLHGGEPWFPLANVWLGVSVENQAAANERVPLLLQTPAAVRFISAEPLLGEINLVEMENTVCRFNPLPTGYEQAVAFHLDALHGSRSCVLANCDSYREESGWIPKLDWVICGGESGPGARPMHPDWARSLRDQCAGAEVAFFFKQWGEWTPGENVDRNEGLVQTSEWFDGRWLFGSEDLACDEGHRDDEPDLYRVGKKAAGSLLDGDEWKQIPEAKAR